MKYRFIFDSYGRFLYEEEDDDFIVRFKVISWNIEYEYTSCAQLYYYSGSVCADDVKHDSEIIVREDEFIHNL